ncbi:MAG TPA: tripartite tricarboxylate transporter substrate binding protein [Ramlibacter sp.]|nr:tripartite tricarboxylate transporter substrate binding protein [Ramlibacter sp.]
MTPRRISRRTALRAAMIAAATLAAPASFAQAKWPMERTMTIVVPFAAGSAFDNVARVLADGIRRKYGNTVVVENKVGASGGIGQNFVAKAAPDGYTFIVSTPGPAANNMLTFRSLPYNPMTDFSFVGMVLRDPIVMAVRRDMPVNSFREFLAHAKANPGKITMGNPGHGSTAHMTQMALQDLARIDLNIIPYKTPTQVMQDLIGQQIDAGMALVGNLMPAIRAGHLKPLVTFGDKRDPQLPNVPTLVEQGYNFSSQPWAGVQGPKGIPREIIVEMNRTINEILRQKENVDKLAAGGVTAATSTPEEFEQIVRAEITKWRPVVTKYNITQE